MKNIFIFLLWVILLSPSLHYAQVQNKETHWNRIESPKKDLSFAVPSNFLIDKEDGEFRITAFQNGVIMSVNIQESGLAKDRLRQMRQFSSGTKAEEVISFTIGSSTGDVYRYKNEKNSSTSIYTATSKAFYTIQASSKNSENFELMKFLYSIRLGNQPIFKQETQSSQQEETILSIASLKSSPIILEALKMPDAEKTKVTYDLESKEKTEDTAKYSRPLIILRKPRPSYTDSARSFGVRGTVKLKINFRATGEIGDITILNKLGSGLDKSVIGAVRKIKFLPAEIDGKSVDVIRVLEYSFNIY